VTTSNWFKFTLLGLIWGSSFLWIKIAVGEVGPLTLVSYRTLFALLTLVVIILIQRPVIPFKRYYKEFFIIGFCNVAVPFVLISWSEQFISSGLASILNATVPLFTMLIAPFFVAEERITPARLVGLIVGFLGVVVLMSNHLDEGSNGLLGIGAMLGGALLYAASAVYIRKKFHGMAPIAQTFGQVFFATVIILPLALIFEAPFAIPHLPATWLAVGWLGVLGSGVAMVMFFGLMNAVGPTRTTLVTYAFPLVGVILGILVLGEHIDGRTIVGGLLILSGIIIVNSKVDLVQMAARLRRKPLGEKNDG
jgi:drug/metabolite transporter (DMT)-like permease